MRKIWDLWKRTAETIGDFQFKLLFSILYLLILTPLGLISSFFTDTLSKKRPPKWTEIKDNTSTVEVMRR